MKNTQVLTDAAYYVILVAMCGSFLYAIQFIYNL